MYLPDDTVLDGLALVECAHRSDPEGAMTVLINCDAQQVASFLAMVVADLLTDVTDDPAEAFAWLREHHTR